MFCPAFVASSRSWGYRSSWTSATTASRTRRSTTSSPGSAAIATSGAYARGDHVVDPFSGRAPQGVLSVTIVGPELATADAYATAAYAMGPDFGPLWTARLPGYQAMTILANGTVLSTGGFPAA
jgi:thiamine biosynthesis lipoprotein ApbE